MGAEYGQNTRSTGVVTAVIALNGPRWVEGATPGP